MNVYLKTKKHTARVADRRFGGIQLPMFFFAQGQIVRPAGEEIFKLVRALGIIVLVSGGAEVSVLGESPELGGNEGAGNGAGIHFPKYHSCRFQEAERRVDSQELPSRTGRQRESVIH